MRICLVYMSSYPWDVRVEKIADFLTEEGHEISVLCRTTPDRPARETYRESRIERLTAFKSGPYSINRFFDIPLPVNPLWYFKILGHCRRGKIDLIICRDIPLVLPSLFAGRRAGIPVILDMAENYPAMFADYIRDSRGWKKAVRFILKNPFAAAMIEKYAVRRLDHIFAVIEESRLRLMGMGVPGEKISIISNTPSLTRYTEETFDVPDGLKIIYIGQLQGSRGVGDAIAAMSEVKKARSDVHLFIGGKGEQETAFRKMINDLELDSQVHYLGWVDPGDVYRWIRSCDVGIVPLRNTRQLAGTIANKLFDFMLCGKPVLVSDLPPMKRIVTDEKCGWIFGAGDVSELAGRILEIADSSELSQLGENGRRAVEERYNWEHDCAIMRGAIKSVTGGR